VLNRQNPFNNLALMDARTRPNRILKAKPAGLFDIMTESGERAVRLQFASPRGDGVSAGGTVWSFETGSTLGFRTAVGAPRAIDLGHALNIRAGASPGLTQSHSGTEEDFNGNYAR
jgi:hypothetical protein